MLWIPTSALENALTVAISFIGVSVKNEDINECSMERDYGFTA